MGHLGKGWARHRQKMNPVHAWAMGKTALMSLIFNWRMFLDVAALCSIKVLLLVSVIKGRKAEGNTKKICARASQQVQGWCANAWCTRICHAEEKRYECMCKLCSLLQSHVYWHKSLCEVIQFSRADHHSQPQVAGMTFEALVCAYCKNWHSRGLGTVEYVYRKAHGSLSEIWSVGPRILIIFFKWKTRKWSE